MNINHQLIVLFLASISIGAAAAERVYRSVDEFVGTLAPDPTQKIEVVEGDLNSDHLSDRAIFSRRSGNSETYDIQKIHILLQTSKGGFYLAQESRSGGFNDDVSLSIDNGSLYVHLEGMNPTHGGTYQFKLYRDMWRMIGLTYSVYDPADLGPDQGAHFRDINFNLLTGDIISKRDTKTGKSVMRDKVIVSPCLLAAYDFDALFCVKNWKTQRGIPVSVLMGAY